MPRNAPGTPHLADEHAVRVYGLTRPPKRPKAGPTHFERNRP